MRKEVQKWHSVVLQSYQALMYDTLIQPHNLINKQKKQLKFEDENGDEMEPVQGFFAVKEEGDTNEKYFIPAEYKDQLPIKVDDYEEVFFKDSARSRSVVRYPLSVKKFKINPEEVWKSNKEFIDTLVPFEHSEPDYWTLSKIVAVMGYVGKTFCGISSEPEGGKSSIYIVLDSLTKKCPVFKPRSIPGVLIQITGDGNMVFDDIHATKNEVKQIMENFSFAVASNEPEYLNGAVKSTSTKKKYDVAQQSITYLFNSYNNYTNPEKQFWDNLWANKDAMKSRFLRMKFKGKLTEKFDRNFDIPGTAAQNKQLYINIAKQLLYLKQLKLTNAYTRRYSNNNKIKLSGRHESIYEEITWGIDTYAENQAEYDRLVKLFNTSIMDYYYMAKQMVSSTSEVVEPTIEEESVVSDAERVLEFIGRKKLVPIEEVKDALGIKEFDALIEKMKKEGEVFEPKLGLIEKL